MALRALSLTAASSIVNGTSFVTASVSFTAGKLYLFCVTTQGVNTTDRAVPTVTGAGQTWDAAGSVLFSSFSAGAVFRCMPTSNASGALTISTGALTQDTCSWVVLEVDDLATGLPQGGNGANAIGVVASNTGTGLTITVNPAFTKPRNGTLSVNFWDKDVGGGAVTATPGSGFSQAAQANANDGGSFGSAVQAQFRAENDTTADVAWSLAGFGLGGVAFEVLTPADPAPVSGIRSQWPWVGVPWGTLGWLGRPVAGALNLAASASAQPSGSAALTTVIRLTASAAVQPSASAALAAGATQIAASAVSQPAGAAALNTAITFSAAAGVAASASASLLAGSTALAAGVIVQPAATAGLATAIRVSAAGQAQPSATAALVAGATQITASAVSQPAGAAALSTAIALSASAGAAVSASAALLAGSTALAAGVIVQPSATAGLVTTIRVSAAGQAQPSATAALVAGATQIAAGAVVRSSASASLSTAIALLVDVDVAPSATVAQLVTAILLTAQAVCRAQSSAALMLGQLEVFTEPSRARIGAQDVHSPNARVGGTLVAVNADRIGTTPLRRARRIGKGTL